MASETPGPDAVPVADEGDPSSADLQYDLAHEAREAAQAAAEPAPPPHVYVATQTEGFDGDYGYDLAHDVPRT